jgi:hypothetical protein
VSEVIKQTNEKGQTMKNNRTIQSRITAALIGGALLGTTLFAQAGAPTKVSGGVKFNPGYGPNFLSFVAIQMADGSVNGQAQFQFRADETSGEVSFSSHFRIDCMHFLDDHTAILGGVVTFDTEPSFIGTTAIFVVQDNGRGTANAPDQSSFPYYSANVGIELNCETAAALIESGAVNMEDMLHPVLAGNIQIKSSRMEASEHDCKRNDHH